MLTLMQQGALGEISDQMSDAFGTMVRSNKNLIAMVNMLLEVYRYEAGRKSLCFAPVNLHQLITEVAEELAPLADVKNLSVNLDLSESAESAPIAKYPGDRLELHRLMTNLIGNAIKFTDSGSIDVSLKAANSPAYTSFKNQPLAWVIIQIEDTGPGISAAEQTKLFERFSSGTHKTSGTGLGLHLCRQIVEAHRGTIHAKSELGKGSLFTIRLPC
jgi:two-component system sensor histidine kinase/response regulator